MNKVVANARAALEAAGIKDGASIMMGGFGLCGIPENLIAALREWGTKDHVVISNNAGVEDFGIGLLLATRQVRKMIATYVGENPLFEQQFLNGDLEVELNPQGTLAERIRAGGAGISAFYTPTGAGTQIALGGLPQLYGRDGKAIKVSHPKESRTFDEREHVLEPGLRADFAFIKGHIGDRDGNIVYRRTARNFNPMMATAATVTIVEVEKLVAPGEIDADHVVTPGLYVDYIFEGVGYEKRIEQRTYRSKSGA